MCLNILDKKPKIANKDILVYKIVRVKKKGSFNLYFSPFQRTLLREYPKEKQVEFIDLFKSSIILGGIIYAYTRKSVASKEINIDNINSYKIIKGVIPTGIEYWIGNNNEIGAKYIKFEVPLIQRIAMFIRDVRYN